jgi:hypothetical protein
MDSKKQYAKSILLGQRISFNCQAMLNTLLRNMSGNRLINDKKFRDKLQESMKDLCTCLNELEEITDIGMSDAKSRINICFQMLNDGDIPGLHNCLQKLYRDDYLSKIMFLSE